jgi:hypothetical protein
MIWFDKTINVQMFGFFVDFLIKIFFSPLSGFSRYLKTKSVFVVLLKAQAAS